MDEATYCRTICKGACCHLRLPDEGDPIPCPRLSADNSCSVYTERYKDGSEDLVVVGYWSSRKYKNLDRSPATRPFFCGRIEQIHARGGLPKEIADNCAVLHPELLENYED